MTEKKKPQGEYSKKRLAGVAGLASTLLVIALVSFLSVGMVGAALGVGIGGFVANFDDVEYNDGDAEIYPVLGEQPACDEAPQIEANLGGEATLNDGVEFMKDLPLPESAFDADDFARITIVADAGDGIQVDDLTLRLTALETANLSLSEADIGENAYGQGDLDDETEAADAYSDTDTGASGAEFGIEADSFNLPEGGSAAAHSVSFSEIDLTELNLFVQILNETNADSHGSVERVIDPDDRDCASLAEASTSDDADDLSTASGGTQLAE